MIELKQFTREDFSRLIDWISSPTLLIQWAGPQFFTYPLDENQLEEYRRLAESKNPKSVIFKAVIAESQEVVGHAELASINKENGSASICRIFVEPSQRGKGICPRMMREILEIGFSQLGLHRIDLRVYESNASATSCYEKVGFVREGLTRKVQKVDGEYWDAVVMSILKEEWEEQCKHSQAP